MQTPARKNGGQDDHVGGVHDFALRLGLVVLVVVVVVVIVVVIIVVASVVYVAGH